ncbi:MAG: aminoacyl-tRNA hydrolase [Acidobacteria bacterium]|nr:aminoacyl-tRNA hydrolase [Acidobacteriota bacterium]
MPEYSYLIAGLGNPGSGYENTPHNLGFMVVDALAAANGVRVTRKENSALVGLGEIAGKPVVLAKPQTYMNLSGVSVKGLIERYELTPAQVVVVYDELDLPWTALKIKPKGSAAGHNGMKSIISSLGVNEFPRVRLGIHPGHPIRAGAEFVLAPFKRSQQKELEETVDLARSAVESIIAEGVEKAMTKFNRRAGGLNEEEE